MKPNFVSIIIPTYNDPNGLARCLRALQDQSYPQNLYEIIVVDNGRSTNLEPIVKLFKQVRLLREAFPGSYAARNTGISNAKGNLIAFTDSDTIPEKDWLKNGVQHLISTSGCGLVAGRINMFFKKKNCPNAVELYESLVSHNQKVYVKEKKFGATANMFTRKSVFEEVGLFNKNLKSRGDLEWGQRVFSRGHKLVYADNVVVWHPARNNLSAMYRRIVRLAGGKIDHKRRNCEALISPRYLLNLLMPPMKEIIVRVFIRPDLKDFQQMMVMIFMILFVHYITSFESLRLLVAGTSKR
jgi:cellulose synthase/poly-beta-1,6-N-acetylglucosamine synthase-like glycosyltransferase